MTEKSWLDEELERERRQKIDISIKESIIKRLKKWLKIKSPSEPHSMSKASTDSSVLMLTDTFAKVGVSVKEANENFSSIANSWTRIDEDELYSCSILGMKLAYEKEENNK